MLTTSPAAKEVQLREHIKVVIVMDHWQMAKAVRCGAVCCVLCCDVVMSAAFLEVGSTVHQ